MWQRRAFLRAAGVGFVASLLPAQTEALDRADLVLAAAVQTSAGKYGAALVSERGEVVSKLTLPDRGHDIVFSPSGARGVVFARQPGTFAVVFDPAGSVAPVTLTSPEGRHFYGHGVFSPDGRLLYATESDFEAAKGVIGIYDATDDYRRIGEMPTYGTGPHELLLMGDGQTLVIANGGIETHPDYGRAELNLDTMDPSVVFVDRTSGELIGQVRLATGLHQLSIRHMAIDGRQRVWFGCQYKGEMADRPQLIGYATRDGEIKLVELPGDLLADMRNYIGSVAVSADGEMIGVSSPVGNLVVAISAETGRPSVIETVRNGCGLAPQGAGFIASSGDGALRGFAGATQADQAFEFGFDNHLAVLA
ncbi:DUF1513 domain-containing protein [Devosia rhodophyticola]|uniref:DUF1513 domain-containing protein n=1 Tax=Devosia rhodophyticola TaxID=3026423 RepID=A0ABY7YVX1_9HYPH|nr:DUF1513 domain-containing protein [Devosia rhodophyticola]WDR05010.1 DUF1513 domain-containing protein [Devosia rhodophyticola]